MTRLNYSPEPDTDHQPARLPAALLAVVAGLLGTVAQIIWLRILIRWYGTSVTTVSATLAAALAALALGAFLFRDGGRRLIGRSIAPIRLASWQLLFAGACVLESALYYVLAQREIGPAFDTLPNTVALIGSCLLVLFPVNLALGGVLPVLVVSGENVPLDESRDGASVAGGSLAGERYAAETLGGAAGCLITGLWLVFTFGLTTSLVITGVFGLSVGALGIVFSKTHISTPPTPQLVDLPLDQTSNWPMLLAILVAGVGSIGMEVVWQRLLILIVGTDNYSYTIVVTSYLLGVCFGAQLYALAARCWGSNPNSGPGGQLPFAWLQFALAVVSVGVLLAFCELASSSGRQWLATTNVFSSPLAKRFTICFGLLVLPTMLVGASFPAAVAALASQQQLTQAATARVYGLGSVGNVFGVLLCGFVLVPALGLQQSALVLCSLALVAAMIASISWSKSSNRNIVWIFGLTALVAGGAISINRPPIGFDPGVETRELLYYREGPANLVSVVEHGEENGPSQRTFRSLSVDGVVIGESDGGVDEKQRMLAHLPLVIDAMAGNSSPRSIEVLTIGLGTGILAGEAAAQRVVEHVTCVELSPAVIEAASLFDASNCNVLNAPNVTVLQSDGIHFLRQTFDRYDAIISDGKSRPGHVGNVAFFSADYYRTACDRLTEHGSFVQWLPLATPLAETQTILKTFAQSFPHGGVLIAAPDSVYLVGRRNAIGWNPDQAKSHLKQSATLIRYFWQSADDIRSMVWLDAKEVATKLPPATPINTADRPALERFASANVETAETHDKVQNLTFLRDLLRSEETNSLVMLESADPAAMNSACVALLDAAIAEVSRTPDWIKVAQTSYQQAFRTLPKLTRGGRLANKLIATLNQDDHGEPTTRTLALAAQFAGGNAELQASIGLALLDLRAFASAASCLHRATRLQPDNANYLVALGRCLLELQKPAAALTRLERAIELDPKHVEAHRQIVHAALAIGDGTRAAKHRLILEELARPLP